MRRLKCIVLLFAVYAVNGGGGVTKNSGITKFWTDDYKVFDQIYGRTSDRDIFKATVPTSFYGVEISKFKKEDASVNKGKQLELPDEDNTASGTQLDPYGLGDNIAQLFSKQALLKQYDKVLAKTTKTPFSYVDQTLFQHFKPVSEATDPETFDYFKHLEHLNKQQSIDFPEKGLGGFKPYVGLSYRPTNPSNSDSYKSIQDILDDQQDKYQGVRQNKESEIKYVNYGQVKPTSRPRKPSVRLNQSNDINKGSRCASGKCRKRPHGHVRIGSRPVIRKIKYTIGSE